MDELEKMAMKIRIEEQVAREAYEIMTTSELLDEFVRIKKHVDSGDQGYYLRELERLRHEIKRRTNMDPLELVIKDIDIN